MDFNARLLGLQQAIKNGPDAVVNFFDELEKEGHVISNIVEFAFRVLENATEETGYTAIYRAGFIIEKHAIPDQVGRLEAVRKRLPPLPGLRDYRYDFDHYIQLLKNKEKGICECHYYASSGASIYSADVKEISTNQETYTSLVECNKCGKRYHVEVDLGYHFPQYRWS